MARHIDSLTDESRGWTAVDNSHPVQPAGSGPARPRSVWADMVVSGADDEEEPEPRPEPGHQDPCEGLPSWPASGLPPSFGRRSAEGEGPAVIRPGPGSGYGGYRPLGSLPPSGLPPSGPPRGSPLPSAQAWHQAGADQPEPEDEQHGPGVGPDEPGGDWDEA